MNVWDFLYRVVLAVISLGVFVAWIAGFVIAKGFWSTLFCCFPFYAWYLVVEKAMLHFHIT